MTKSFKSFRKVGFSVRPDIYDRNEKGDRMTSAEKEARDKGVEKQSKEDFASLLELRDIYDELHTIKKLFKEQRDTLIGMCSSGYRLLPPLVPYICMLIFEAPL